MNFGLWLSYAVATPFLWAWNNVIDRLLMTKLIKNEHATTFMICLMKLPFFVLFWFLAGWYVPEIRDLLLAVFAGFLNAIPIIFYYKALEKADASSVALMYNASNPLFVLVISAAFLSERLIGLEGVGFVLLLFAGILASVKFEEKIRFKKSLAWIIVAALFWAPSDVLFDALIPRFPSLASLLTWIFAGMFLTVVAFFLIPQWRSRCRIKNFHWSKLAWGFFIVGTLIAFLATITFLKALELGSVSLTVVITSIQPLFVFVLELVLVSLWSIFEKVDLGMRSLLPKALALICIIAGIWFLRG